MEKKLVVITLKDSEYYGMLGLARPRTPGWKTITVEFGCVHVQFYEEHMRSIKFGEDKVVNA